MKLIVAFVVLACLMGNTAVAQHRSVTISRNDSLSYRNKTAENLGYAQLGLTAFLALLDSGTGVRQNGVPSPGYNTYPGGGPGAFAGGVVGGGAPGAVIVGGVPVVICDNPSWCTWPSPLGPGPGADGFAAGYRAGQQWARERRIAGAIQYHTDYDLGLEAGGAPSGW